MATEIVLDPAEVATSRTELHLNQGSINVERDGIDWGEAAIEQYLAEAARGQIPVDFRIPNRIITIPLLLGANGAAGFDAAKQLLQAKVGLFQSEGGWLKRGTGLYADIVDATLKFPDRHGHLGVEGDVVLTLEALPDFYGDEITLDDIVETSAAEIVTKLKLSTADAVIAGDYPGRVRIVVDDDQGQLQRGLLWAFRCRHYSSAATAALRYEAEALTPLDTAAIATVTGASGGGSNNVVQHANLATAWTPVLSTQILSGSAHMTHKGSYRVWARVRSTSATPPSIRFVWDVGDLAYPIENSRWTIPAASNFYMADLGEIRLDPSPAGTHRWQGVFQAIGSAGGENVQIDKIWLQDLDEAAGVLRAPVNADPGLVAYSARDEFNQTAGDLHGKALAAPAAQTWDTNDQASGGFTVETVGKTAQRSVMNAADSSAGQFAIAGTGTPTATAVQVDFKFSSPGQDEVYQGVVARYTDVSNHVLALVGDAGKLILFKEVAGVQTALLSASVTLPVGAATWYSLRLAIDTNGRWFVWFWPAGAFPGEPVAMGQDSALATGGALDDGKVGFYDAATASVSVTRNYDNFAAWVPAFDAVLNPSQSAEIRTDGIVREDSSGTGFGPVSHVVGDLPRIPPSGAEARPVELLLKGTRGDFDGLPDAGIDDISARVHYRPSWLFPPAD